jgi:hypothetical protein
VPGMTTTVENTKVVLIATNSYPIAMASIIWWADNPGLSNRQFRFCANFPEPAPGGITILTADRPVTGAYGIWLLHGVQQDNPIGEMPCISIALKPAL